LHIAAAAVAVFLASYWLPLTIDFGLIALTLGATAALLFSPESRFSLWPWPHALVIAFAASLVLSILLSGHPQLSLVLSLPFVPATLLYLVLSQYVRKGRGVAIVQTGLSVGAGLTALVVLLGSVYQRADPVGLIKSLAIPILVVPNDLLLLAICIPLILSGALASKMLFLKIFFMISTVLCLAAIVMVNSRSALVASAFGLFIVAVFQRGRWMWISIIGGAAGLLALDGIRGFSLLLKFAQAPQCDPRQPLWAAAARLWSEHPLLGYGMHNYRELYRDRIESFALPACSMVDGRLTPWPHNLFLELLSSQGVVGALPFAVLIAWGVARSYRTARYVDDADRLLAVGLLGSFGAFIFASLIELTFLRYWVVIMVATLIGLAAALKQPSTPFPGAYS
jgi:O-antigen ligase